MPTDNYGVQVAANLLLAALKEIELTKESNNAAGIRVAAAIASAAHSAMIVGSQKAEKEWIAANQSVYQATKSYNLEILEGDSEGVRVLKEEAQRLKAEKEQAMAIRFKYGSECETIWQANQFANELEERSAEPRFAAEGGGAGAAAEAEVEVAEGVLEDGAPPTEAVLVGVTFGIGDAYQPAVTEEQRIAANLWDIGLS